MKIRLLVLVALLLGGCASDPVPVGESKVVTRAVKVSGGTGQGGIPAPAVQVHVVERGDTLFSIAWRHGLDYREVARINGIGEPWVIRVGQRLRLREPVPAARKPAGTQAPVAVANKAVAPKAAVTAGGVTTTASARAVAAAAGTVPAVTAPSPAAATAATPAPAATVDGWSWPAMGRVLSAFNPGGSGPRGISLEGKAGEPVRAAREGRVVYTGSSLVGYGQLVIVKHDEVYLSAYAHNSRLLVKEGDRVRAGDLIAEMGSTGADRVKLHFEIRRNGEPVDPQGLLPRR